MAKYVIEFDEKDGCKNCPFCQFKEGFEILGDTGFYCTNKTPNKFITYAADKTKAINKPSWCNLIKYSPTPAVPVSIPGRSLTNSAYSKNTERIIVQESINPTMIMMYNGALDLDSYIKEHLIRGLIQNPALRQSIKWTEIEKPLAPDRNCIIRGELEVVKPDNRAQDLYHRNFI